MVGFHIYILLKSITKITLPLQIIKSEVWHKQQLGISHVELTTPRYRQQWVTKHVSGFCSVGKMALRTGLQTSKQCPRCEEIKTAAHVWTCKNQEVEQLWGDKMAELREVLNQACTPQKMINAIIDGLQGWRNSVDHIFNTTTNAGIAGELQNRMGGKHFFEGRPHKVWRNYFTQHQNPSVRGNPGKQWIGALVKKLQDMAWDLWEHRNGILHNKDIGYAAQLADTKIRQLLWQPQLYQIQSIQQLVTHEAEEICQWGLHQKQHWILRVEAALQNYIRRRDNTQYQQEREGM
jgi:hypothetical protein